MIRIILIACVWVQFLFECLIIFAKDLPRRGRIAFYTAKIVFHASLYVFHKGIANAALSVDMSLEDRFQAMKKTSDIVAFYTRQAALSSGVLILLKAATLMGGWGVLLSPFIISLIGIVFVYSTRMYGYVVFAFWESHPIGIALSDDDYSKSRQHKITLYAITFLIVIAPAAAVIALSPLLKT